MPIFKMSGGPWGGGGNNGGDGRGPWGGGGDNEGDREPPRRPGGGNRPPDIDDMVRKGQEHLRVLMGGRGSGGGGGDGGSGIGKGGAVLIAIAVLGLWLFKSFYTVRPDERSVELFLGKFSSIGQPGLNFAPWPLVTYEKLVVERENTIEVGGRGDDGLMLTGDENFIDIGFDVVWRISDPKNFLFKIADQEDTIKAVSTSVMRELAAQSELSEILTIGRPELTRNVQTNIQEALNQYEAGVEIVRVNLDNEFVPDAVRAAFDDVQAAEQERVTLRNKADAYANQKLAGARGRQAELLEQAEGYRAEVVNQAKGEASRFSAVLTEYLQAPEVTRKRLYLETMEKVMGAIDKVIIDQQPGGGQGVVPYLSLNELRRNPGASQ
ncbi:FtsH protease activity modulator HflK [Halovulum sp. GXIMD14793]